MLEDRRSRLFISFVLAFALWFYVVGQLDPVTKKTYRGITITLTNEQSLSDSGLAVLSSSDDSLRVTVSGKRNSVSRLSKADIVATVDLTNAAEGTNNLPIDLKIPEDIEIDNQSLNEITVNVEERITEEKEIKVFYLGEYPDGLEPETVKTDPETAEVSGASSLVKKVAYVKAEVDVSEMPEELYSTTSALTAVTSGGAAVENISMADTQCKVTSIMYGVKKVKLEVPVTDKSKDGYERTTSCQDKITIKGPVSALDDITKVVTKSVNITGIKEDTEISVTPVLPEGVYAADKDKDIKLTVEVSKAEQ
ncbi:MAG: hypothetical protein IJH41_02595 [Eubacterium sp.]|nr:hypothetical protein [Eubacterium sp.]